jgi:hypothetical protein
MLDTYTIVHIIHLLAAIIFLGFIFADVVVLSVLKKDFGEIRAKEIKESIGARGKKIFPFAVLVLLLSGGFMMSKYINSEAGMFNSNLQLLLLTKIAFATLIFAGIIYSLTRKLFDKPANPHFAKYFHRYVLFFGLCIVILAKVMFVL